jgi:DedD protein
MLDKSSTHRLIGAGIMLVAAAAILPVILDGERPPELDVDTRVSKAPVIPNVVIKPAQPLPIVEKQIEYKKLNKAVDVPKDVIQPAKKPVTTKEAVVKGSQVATKKAVQVKKLEKSSNKAKWTLQIASFKSRSNASALVKKLQAANYPAYTITTKTLFKVYVGPEIKRTRSETLKQEIKKKFSLDGFVVKYSAN